MGRPGDRIVADWTGELSNQLLGRLKKQFPLVRHRHLAQHARPSSWARKCATSANASSYPEGALCYAEGRILVELQMNCDRDFEIPEGDDSMEPPVNPRAKRSSSSRKDRPSPLYQGMLPRARHPRSPAQDFRHSSLAGLEDLGVLTFELHTARMKGVVEGPNA